NILLLHADGNVTLVDVQPARNLNETQVRSQMEWTRKLCQAKSWHYEVFSRADTTVMQNIRALALGRRSEWLSPDLVGHAREIVSAATVTIGEAIAAKPLGCNDAEWRAAVAACLWAGQVTVDLHVPLDSSAILTPVL